MYGVYGRGGEEGNRGIINRGDDVRRGIIQRGIVAVRWEVCVVGRGGDGKGSAERKEIGGRVDDERERGEKEVVSRERSEKLDLVGEGVKIGQE